jgi:hypothetical protein
VGGAIGKRFIAVLRPSFSVATHQKEEIVATFAPSETPRITYVQGDHVCMVFMTPEVQLAAAIDYIKQGLARKERCLYVVGEHDLDTFRGALRASGIAVEDEEARGALVLITKNEGHLASGTFDPNSMIAMLEDAVRSALDAGFAGLCAAGDMTWLLDEAPGSERIAEYEARLTPFYRSHRALGLCLYRRNMPKILLDHCLATHPTVRLDGPILLANPFYELPELAESRKGSAEHVDERISTLRSA